jgi:hypothetical protein
MCNDLISKTLKTLNLTSIVGSFVNLEYLMKELCFLVIG